MAQEIVINVKLEAQGVVENINKIEAELAKLNEERDNLLKSGLSPEALTNALNAVDSEINKLDSTYKKITQSTNSYKIAQEDNAKAQEKAAAAAKRLETINRTAEGVTKGLAGSVNLATSAFAIFGAENEEVAETLKKVQAAAGFATGIKDLTESFKALNLGGIALNKTLLANPFVLIATLVVTLIGAFGGFEVIIKAVTSAVQLAFAPLTALFGAFGSGKAEVDLAKQSLDDYNTSLGDLQAQTNLATAALEGQLEKLELEGASLEVIAAKRREINETNLQSAIEESKLLDTRIDQVKFLIDEEKEGSKARLELQLTLDELEQKRINNRATQVRAQNKIEIDDLKAKAAIEKENAEKLKSANEAAEKAEEKKITAANKAEAERQKLQQDTLKAIQDRLKTELETITTNNAVILENEKQLLIEKLKIAEQEGASQEELNEIQLGFENRRVEIETQTNNQIIAAREKFQLTKQEIDNIGADEEKKIRTQIGKDILDAQKKNNDNEINGLKKQGADRIKAEQQNAKDILDSIEVDYLLKKGELLDKAATDEEFKKEGYDLAIRELEIKKQKALLSTLEVGSKEYLAKVNEINEAEEKLREDQNTKLQKKTLEVVQGLVNSIGNIVQEVSPLFESVGQTALQTLESIGSQVPGLLATIADEGTTAVEKITAGLQFAANSIGQINEIFQKNSEERIEQIDNEEQARIAALEKQKEAGLITEEQLQTGRTAIEKEAAKKRREEQRKAFEAEKAIRITQAVLQTAAAVLNAFSSGVATPIIGPATGAIFAGIAAAFGAVQIGLIASQKFPGDGGSASATAPSVPSVPTQAAQGSITPQTFQPNTFGTGVSQEQTFGQSGNSNVGGNVLRAYVVESDIASTSNRLNTIRQTSEL